MRTRRGRYQKLATRINTLYQYIKFLMMNKNVGDLNDYKKSKAYSYFENGWLEIYHTMH